MSDINTSSLKASSQTAEGINFDLDQKRKEYYFFLRQQIIKERIVSKNYSRHYLK